MKLFSLFFAAFLSFSASVHAGPIFHLVGSGGIAPLHPEGNDNGDRMTGSLYWGITTTGRGFMDGRISFADSFLLPLNPGDSVSFSAGDIEEVYFQHVYAPGLSAPGGIFPGFSFTALAGDIVSASGTISYDGLEYRFSNVGGAVSIVTSATTGGFNGTWAIDGGNVVLNHFTGGGSTTLTQDSQTPGNWELTGFSSASVPEPGSLMLSLLGVVTLRLARRKKKGL